MVTAPADRTDALVASLHKLDAVGLVVSARVVEVPHASAPGEPTRIAVTGNDRPGIIRDVSRILAERGVNVEELTSRVESAPMSGNALFVAQAVVRMPPTLRLADLRTAFETLGGDLIVDLIGD
jgi:glycine cleavage system regulatory protein